MSEKIARRANSNDVAALAKVLARAFYDDPISQFLFPADARREKAMERFFRIEIGSMYLEFGDVWTTDGLEAAAIWAPPGMKRQMVRDLVRMIPMTRYIAAHPVRSVRVLSTLEAKHPKVPHYYLATLGTDPSYQGKGFGTCTMAPVLQKCDNEGLPAYLESSKERNVPLYHRHGFEVTEELVLPCGGPKVWLMFREPRI